MSVSVMGLPRLALLAPVGMLFVALSAGPSMAQPELHGPKPGQVREVVGPAATVISTAHYQAELTLGCGGTSCSGDFPKPGNKRRHNITRLSCFITASGTTFRTGFADLRSATDVDILYQWLPVDYASPDGNYTLNRAVDMLVSSAQHIRVFLTVNSSTATQASCTASGTLETLQ